MGLPLILAVQGTLWGISYLLRDDAEDETIKDSTGRGSPNIAKEGDALPVVYGRCRVDSMRMTLYGSDDPFDVYLKEGTKQILGNTYTYTVFLQMTVCAVADAPQHRQFTKLYFSNRLAWTYPVGPAPTNIQFARNTFWGTQF